MTVTPSDVLFAWRGGNGIQPTVGGQPSLSRGGDKWIRQRRAGGSALYTRVQSDQVPLAWTQKGGVLPPGGLRALDLERAVTPTNDDAVRFGPASEVAWSYVNVGGATVKTSAFTDLPTNGEAREVVGDGNGAVQLRQNIGTFGAGTLETSIIMVENTAPGDEVWWALFNSTSSSYQSRASYNFATGATAIESGTGTVNVLASAESGPNGHPWAVLSLRGGGPSGDDRRFWIFPGGNTGVAGNGCTVHYAHHVELAYATNPTPYVGSPTTRPADEFYVSPGPYRTDAVQAFYLSWVAAMPHGDTREFERTVVHGDGSKPWVLLWQDDDTHGQLNFDYDNAGAEGASVQSIDLGSPEPGDLIEVVYAFNPVDGTMRLVGRIDRGGAQDSGASTPSSFSTPSSLGAENRIVYNEDGDLSGARSGRHLYLRHLGVLGSSMDADPLTGDAGDVLDELADVPIGPHLAGHPQP